MKSVVVIGGGFCGAHVAKKLENKFSVTLIDTKDYKEYTPGILRALVDPTQLRKLQALHEQYLKKAFVIRGTATKIGPSNVYLGKEKIPYDYLVIATGFEYHEPFRKKNVVTTGRGRELRNSHQALLEAKDVLIIGGGIVGVETAGEIATHFPNKNITLAHSRDELVHMLPPKARKSITQWMQKKGVNIIYNVRVKAGRGNNFVAGKEKIKADFALLCVGNKPNTTCATKTDKRNAIVVDKHLRAQGKRNVFAGGDATNVCEVKLAQNAEKHAEIIVENILRTENGQALLSYEPAPRPSLISLGTWNGVFTYKNISFSGLIPALLKSYVEWRWRWQYR